MKQNLSEKLKNMLSKEKLKSMSRTVLEFIFNPPLLICLGIAWIITNGWSYVVFGLGVFLDIPVMIGIASAYLAFLWVPFTPEKIITVIIAITLLKKFFPNDEKTLKKLENLYAKYKVKKETVKESARESFHESVQDTIETIAIKQTSRE
ncbi:MAG: hypothetical protein IJA90_02805 [Peptococcaceae bacterium]|nr:hypothetical protein [Peptococcaceae bacterium]